MGWRSRPAVQAPLGSEGLSGKGDTALTGRSWADSRALLREGQVMAEAPGAPTVNAEPRRHPFPFRPLQWELRASRSRDRAQDHDPGP